MKITPATGVSLRPIQEYDREFLFRVYASTRREELAVVGWSQADEDAFLRMQFAAQHQYYQEHYQGADFSVILACNLPVGRLYVAVWDSEIRIIDISILGEYRDQGIGSSLLLGLKEKAQESGCGLTIHVEKMNPARRLYERLGFRIVADKGVYDFMEWRDAR